MLKETPTKDGIENSGKGYGERKILIMCLRKF